MVVIENASALTEEQKFWARVAAEQRTVSAAERTAHLVDGTIGDDLADGNDDVISAEAAW